MSRASDGPDIGGKIRTAECCTNDQVVYFTVSTWSYYLGTKWTDEYNAAQGQKLNRVSRRRYKWPVAAIYIINKFFPSSPSTHSS